MIIYLVTFFLVTCSRSFGNPVIKTEVPPVSAALANLANNCGSSVLVSLIKSKIDECSVAAGKKQFECLLFTDINAQLCNAVAENQLNIPQENITDKIMKFVDIGQLCTSAKDWNAIILTIYPQYKATADKVFKNELKCATICGVDNVYSQDSNFFCKYYKWGVELLTHSNSVTEVPKNNNSYVSEQKPNPQFQQISELASVADGANIASNRNTTKSLDPEAPPSNASEQQTQRIADQQTQRIVGSLKSSDPVKQNGAEEEDNYQLPPSAEQPPAAKGFQQLPSAGQPPAEKSLQQSPLADQLPAAKGYQQPPSAMQPPVKGFQQLPLANQPQSAGVSFQGQNSTQGVGVSSTVNKAESLEKSSGGDAEKADAMEKPEESVIKDETDQKGNPKSQDPANEDYNDDDGSEAGDTLPGEDNDLRNLGDFEENNDMGKTKSIASKTFKESNSRYLGETDALASNNIIPDYSDDDEDHFFSFFLTVIIMVVLLYILYHNKNKVSKLFFGLLVEGRQGRRRNSRGHAYRRLDTLEQAMNTNSAAPPSKIIY